MSNEDLKVILDESLSSKLKDLATKQDIQKITSETQLLRSQNSFLADRLTATEKYCNLLERQLVVLSRKQNEDAVVLHFPAEGKADKVDFAKQTCRSKTHMNILTR